MRNITWVTSSYMLQVDLPILKKIKNSFNVIWFLLGSDKDKIQTARTYAEKNNINLCIRYIHHHHYSPLSCLDYIKLIKEIALLKSNIYYFDVIAFPYLIFVIKKYLPSNKVVMAMHHGNIHDGMKLKYVYKYYLAYLCKQPFNFQYYSNTQASYFTGNINDRYIIPLALNDYGKVDEKPQEGCVIFLSFGHIISTKNIGLLIEAACRLKEMSNKPFKVRIVGHCRIWGTKYQPLIKYPELFELTIKSVPDSDIPYLFSTSHYLVLPYKSVTQSGPLRIAYGYNLPVIATDLDGFKESMVDGVTGILFKNKNVEDLVEKMKNVLDQHPTFYISLKNAQKKYLESNLCTEVVAEKYKLMFDNIIKGYEHES